MRNYMVNIKNNATREKFFVVIPADDEDSAIESAKESLRENHTDDEINALDIYIEGHPQEGSVEQQMLDAIQANLDNIGKE
jgi:hypothetical protein